MKPFILVLLIILQSSIPIISVNIKFVGLQEKKLRSVMRFKEQDTDIVPDNTINPPSDYEKSDDDHVEGGEQQDDNHGEGGEEQAAKQGDDQEQKSDQANQKLESDLSTDEGTQDGQDQADGDSQSQGQDAQLSAKPDKDSEVSAQPNDDSKQAKGGKLDDGPMEDDVTDKQTDKTDSSASQPKNNGTPAKFDEEQPDYYVIKKIERPLDRLFYVQGFKFIDTDTIVESTGLYGESVMHYLDATTFKEKKQTPLNKAFFGEGSDWILNDAGQKEIHQMTYKERMIFVYDENLVNIKNFTMPKEMHEGWGLTHHEEDKGDGKIEMRFWATDGSNKIFIINQNNWTIEKTIQVKDPKEHNRPIPSLNDLEFVKDKLLINIYLSSRIIQVDPQTGNLLQSYDFSKLVNDFENSKVFADNNFNRGHCLNGIAYNKFKDELWITGKKWNYVYQVQLKNMV